tara:strand:+ start:226212 stop:226328 length:117 start_codon:yes stop_codon:yes gene_type:complete
MLVDDFLEIEADRAIRTLGGRWILWRMTAFVLSMFKNL